MIVFSIIIACAAHSTACTLPGPEFGYFEAESAAMCEQNVRRPSEMYGLRDFIVTCSDRKS